ncbi:MAG TPA: rhomboid family intramembrane serine protease [Verrucomicrobiae bacterium]|jgi:membrane associated rhomboid family serine protease
MFPITIAVLIVTAVVTFLAFKRPELKERLMFKPAEILRDRQYDRMLTSGLIHADWRHFLFNAFSFYCFARNIELIYGAKVLLLIYGSSILGGSLLSLLIHRHQDYRALGASGGVCGVIFASIFLLPGSSITMFPLPIGIPAYLYAIGFLVFSFVSHRRQQDNIGHDAHLGGAIIGLLVATALYPGLIAAAPWMFSGVLILSIIFMVILIFDPLHLLEHQFASDGQKRGNVRYQEYDKTQARNQKLKEIDRLLDKVSQGGLSKLSNSERKRLEQLSGEIHPKK